MSVREGKEGTLIISIRGVYLKVLGPPLQERYPDRQAWFLTECSPLYMGDEIAGESFFSEESPIPLPNDLISPHSIHVAI